MMETVLQIPRYSRFLKLQQRMAGKDAILAVALSNFDVGFNHMTFVSLHAVPISIVVNWHIRYQCPSWIWAMTSPNPLDLS
jgi:hypothetical protein